MQPVRLAPLARGPPSDERAVAFVCRWVACRLPLWLFDRLALDSPPLLAQVVPRVGVTTGPGLRRVVVYDAMLALAIIPILAPGPPGDDLSRAISMVAPVDFDAATDETGRVRPVDIRCRAGVRRGDRSCVSLAPPARRVVRLRKESVAFLEDSIQLGWCPNVGLGDDVANRLLVTVGGRSAGLDTNREGDVGCDHLVPLPRQCASRPESSRPRRRRCQ